MTVHYQHLWKTTWGDVADHEGNLTASGKIWQEGLAGLSMQDIKRGMDMLEFNLPKFPPPLNAFKKLCLGISEDYQGLPEPYAVVNILFESYNQRFTHPDASLKQRFKHPIVLDISGKIDRQYFYTLTSIKALQVVKPVYEDLLKTGWQDWPEHADSVQKALEVDKKPRDLNIGRKALSELKKSL